MPMIKSLIIHMWDRSKIFLKKMGGIILVGSIVVWVLSSFPSNPEFSKDYAKEIGQAEKIFRQKINAAENPEKALLERERDAAVNDILRLKNIEKTEKSFLGHIGKFLSPVFEPIGIDWRGSVALLTGLVAKEIVVSTLGVLFSAGDEPEALKQALRSSGMTPLSALSMMLFVLLYVPCLATVAAIMRETGSIKWAAFSAFYSTSAAWLLAFLAYQGGKIMGF
jgi:ferrous iron transport protein B